jgi:hypothetical protein
MALVARNGFGKTTFAREILDIRDWVVVIGTKPKDPDLYEAFERKGYVIKRSWSPDDTSNNRVIFAPPLPDPTKQGKEVQTEAIRKVLVQLYLQGRWCVYFDELLYLSRDLKLTNEINLLYEQGRALGLTLVAGTQRPRSVPLNMFEQSEWFGLWRISDEADRARAAEMLGDQKRMAMEAARVMPKYELLLANTATDESFRTKVYT